MRPPTVHVCVRNRPQKTPGFLGLRTIRTIRTVECASFRLVGSYQLVRENSCHLIRHYITLLRPLEPGLTIRNTSGLDESGLDTLPERLGN